MNAMRWIKSACLLLIASASAQAKATGIDMTTKDGKTYVLQLRYEANGCEVKLSFNDYPALKVNKKMVAGGLPLNQMMRRGINRIKLFYKSGPKQKDCYGSMAIERAKMGATGGETIWRKRWRGCPKKPVRIAATISLQKLPDIIVWKATPKTSLSLSDKKAIYAQIRALHKAFVAKDTKKVAALIASAQKNSAVAFGKDLAKERKQSLAFIRSMFKNKSFKVRPLPALPTLVFRRYMGGRMIEVQTQKGESPLVAWEIFFSLSFSHINGKWERIY